MPWNNQKILKIDGSTTKENLKNIQNLDRANKMFEKLTDVGPVGETSAL